MDARHVCEHTGDCSVWGVHPKNETRCKICDCGALKKAVHIAKKSEDNDDLWKAWADHILAIDKSMGM